MTKSMHLATLIINSRPKLPYEDTHYLRAHTKWVQVMIS